MRSRKSSLVWIEDSEDFVEATKKRVETAFMNVPGVKNADLIHYHDPEAFVQEIRSRSDSEWMRPEGQLAFLVDYWFPLSELNGADIARTIRRVFPEAAILLFSRTRFENRESIFESSDYLRFSGFDDVVTKDEIFMRGTHLDVLSRRLELSLSVKEIQLSLHQESSLTPLNEAHVDRMVRNQLGNLKLNDDEVDLVAQAAITREMLVNPENPSGDDLHSGLDPNQQSHTVTSVDKERGSMVYHRAAPILFGSLFLCTSFALAIRATFGGSQFQTPELVVSIVAFTSFLGLLVSDAVRKH